MNNGRGWGEISNTAMLVTARRPHKVQQIRLSTSPFLTLVPSSLVISSATVMVWSCPLSITLLFRDGLFLLHPQNKVLGEINFTSLVLQLFFPLHTTWHHSHHCSTSPLSAVSSSSLSLLWCKWKGSWIKITFRQYFYASFHPQPIQHQFMWCSWVLVARLSSEVQQIMLSLFISTVFLHLHILVTLVSTLVCDVYRGCMFHGNDEWWAQDEWALCYTSAP